MWTLLFNITSGIVVLQPDRFYAPRTDVFACVWMVFSTRDRCVVCVWMVFSTKDRSNCLCVDGVQHQGQDEIVRIEPNRLSTGFDPVKFTPMGTLIRSGSVRLDPPREPSEAALREDLGGLMSVTESGGQTTAPGASRGLSSPHRIDTWSESVERSVANAKLKPAHVTTGDPPEPLNRTAQDLTAHIGATSSAGGCLEDTAARSAVCGQTLELARAACLAGYRRWARNAPASRITHTAGRALWAVQHITDDV
ncbi:hypothetical protein Bbelb_148110 [Branchiostoma belcheri]|nr:hypothetical protein Bbelb_148110 [Branchiostoma belcheri]